MIISMLLFTIQQFGHLGNLIVQVTGTQHDEYVEGTALDKIEHLALRDELFLDARTQMVVDEL